MRVCIVSKFPPIQGGIASRTYWRVRQLLDAGHDIAVVTNSAVVETQYCVRGCEAHLQRLVKDQGLQLHEVGSGVPWHIPVSQTYLELLVSELLVVLGSGNWDFIESGYLVPYGIAGHFASLITGVPHVVRHGGSDIAKFLDSPLYDTLLNEVLRSAKTVVTDSDHKERVSSTGARVELGPAYEPYHSIWSPAAARTSSGPPTAYAYIGKINFHWRRKGLHHIVDWFSKQDPNEASLRFVAQGIGCSDFCQWALEKYGMNIELEPFVPPWEVPMLLQDIDAVFCLDLDDTVRNRSLLAIEAEAAGARVVRSPHELTRYGT